MGGIVLFSDGACQAADTRKIELPRLVVQTGHDHVVYSVAFSPDGRTAVSGSRDKTLKLWDVPTGREIRTLMGHKEMVMAVAYSPDGKSVVSASQDGTLKLWDVASGLELRTFNGHKNQVSSVAFSPDGKMIVSGSWDGTIKIWEAGNGRELRTIKPKEGWVYSVVFSMDGKTIASGIEESISLWDVASGREVHSLKGHTGGVNSVAFSPDGRTVLSGSDDKTLKLWDVGTGKELKTFSGHTHWVKAVAFSPDGKTAVSGSMDNTLKLWDIASGRELKSKDVGEKVASVAFSSDGKMVLSGTMGKAVNLWEVSSSGTFRTMASYGSAIYSVAYSPDGKILASGNHDGNITLWNLSTGRVLMTLKGHGNYVISLSFSQDGKTLASVGAGIKLWDVPSGRELRTLGVERFDRLVSVALSPNGKMLVSGSYESLLLWDVASGRQLCRLVGHEDVVRSVAFSPDGKTVVSASHDGAVKLWDVAAQREIRTLKGHEDALDSVAFSPDGKMLVSAGGDSIKLWDASRGRELRMFTSKGWIHSVAFSPDGKRIVSSNEDQSVSLWDVGTGKEIRTLTGHDRPVWSAAFSPDGRTVASGSWDDTLKLWDAATGRQLAALTAFNDGTWVVTDPEAHFDTADLEDMPHLHWIMPDDPLTPVPLEAFMKDYYEPRLLTRILNGEKLKPVRALMDLNRVQPEVRIVSVRPDRKDAERAIVEVEVSGARKAYIRDGKIVPMSTAAHDLRLFREGQLVGHIDGRIVKSGDKPYRKTFNVRLPSAMHGQDITLSAYAFNDDRVKSPTVRQTYRVPSSVKARKGNAYLISVGVNQYDNPDLTLGFAANDAQAMIDTLKDRLKGTHSYQQIVPIALISNEQQHHAGKAHLQAVLDRLAGKSISNILKAVPRASQLQPATPDDLVIITFSGHGYADTSGDFYLLTQDAGIGSLADQLKRSISSEELSLWLKDIDAGDMTLIVDACHSAASIEGQGYKPGPMGSRGLGQLAFDKGLRLLAASQANEFALEHASLEHGILSFALVTNGIEAFEADRAPKDRKIMLDEWLHYGVDRVPTLAEEIKNGRIQVANRDISEVKIRGAKLAQGKSRVAQQPALFDFSKKRRQVEVAEKPAR